MFRPMRSTDAATIPSNSPRSPRSHGPSFRRSSGFVAPETSQSSAGGVVSDIVYDNNCLTGVEDLLDFDPFYSSGNGSHIPDFQSVTVDGLKSVSSVSGAQSVLEGYSSSDPLGLTLENVSLDVTKTSAEYANIGLYKANLSPSGTGVKTSTVSGSGSVPSCSFPGFPAL